MDRTDTNPPTIEMASPGEGYLSVSEAARMKEVSRTTIYNAVKTGKLTGVSLVGRTAILKTELLGWTPSPTGGARNHAPMTEAAKEKLSKSQKERWAKRNGKLV